jgi:esterase/lipase superfamily enzyme
MSPFSRMAFGRRACLLLLSCSLPACAGVHEGIMKPVTAAAPASASTVTMLVATTRKPSGNPGTLFSGERSPNVSLDRIAISIPPDNIRKAGDVQWPARLPADPGKNFAVLSVEPQSIGDAGNWLRTSRHNGHVLVFVHGFNNQYSDAVFRFAQIIHDSGADVAAACLTTNTIGKAPIFRARHWNGRCRRSSPTPP